MLDVCFGDSECGSLRLALRKSSSGVMFPYRNMELGKISENDFISGRRKWTDNLFDICSKKERQEIYDEDDERFQNIINAAKKGEMIRIWYSDCAYSKCGFYHLIYSLKEYNTNILVVEFPESELNGNPKEKMSWGHLSPFDVDKFVVLQKPLEFYEKKVIVDKWQKLMDENSELRITINGDIISVADDYFDDEIMRYAPNDEFKVVNLVGFMLGNSKHFLYDVFVTSRIKFLIKQGKFQVIKEAKKGEDYIRNTIIKRTEPLEINFD